MWALVGGFFEDRGGAVEFGVAEQVRVDGGGDLGVGVAELAGDDYEGTPQAGMMLAAVWRSPWKVTSGRRWLLRSRRQHQPGVRHGVLIVETDLQPVQRPLHFPRRNLAVAYGSVDLTAIENISSELLNTIIVNRPGFRRHFVFTKGVRYGEWEEVPEGVAGAVAADGHGGVC